MGDLCTLAALSGTACPQLAYCRGYLPDQPFFAWILYAIQKVTDGKGGTVRDHKSCFLLYLHGLVASGARVYYDPS